MVGFSKNEFNNKLLGDITLLRVTLGVIWTQPIYIHTYIYMCVYNKLLDDITLLRGTLGVTWTQPIYVCVY